MSYVSQIPGVTDKFLDNEVRDIIEHATNNVSVATDMPQKKLLTPEQTSKMFELMNSQNLNPADLHLGYQSLSQFNEHCEVIDG